VAKLVWRVKLVAELRPGVVTEPEVACIERDEQAGLADLGLRLAETKQITAALQAEIVPTQVAVVGEQRRYCSSCARQLATTTAGFMRHVCREVIPHGDAIGCPPSVPMTMRHWPAASLDLGTGDQHRGYAQQQWPNRSDERCWR
jgi:hypothetical protein